MTNLRQVVSRADASGSAGGWHGFGQGRECGGEALLGWVDQAGADLTGARDGTRHTGVDLGRKSVV